MKNIKNKIGMFLLALITVWSCQDDDKEFGAINTPENLEISSVIQGQDVENPNGDGSGLVKFTAVAEHAINYKYVFSDGTTINSPNGIANKRFTQNGINTYEVTVIATGRAGVASSQTFEITVFSNFTDDEAVQFLTGGTTKKWYWSASEPAHLGVGENSTNPATNFWSNYYSAAPFEKAGSPDSNCIYEDELVFTLDNGALKYELNNGGRTFFNAAYVSQFGGGGNSDLCLVYNSAGVKNVQLGPSESILMTTNIEQTRGTSMTFSDGGFMGYYIGQNTYEILSITNNRMVVRAVAGNDAGLAWYHIFTTTPINQQGGGSGGDEDYTNLVWSDEFNTDGAPDPSKWGYDIGRGNNGWGNQEAQYYTDRADNVIVQGGSLRITAKAENYLGANYTSARLKTEGKYDFTYGKVEFRAKLPSGGGTWPATWLLGANYQTNEWPACGEIDVMEHKGNEPGIIHGSLHYPGNFGGNANTNTTTVANVSSEFHVYSVIWSPSSIRFFVDGNLYHSYNNIGSSPYNADFFMIINLAMGGTFGGNIDAAFTQSTLEVDYVRVYQ